MNESSSWSNLLRDIAGTYAAVDAQKQIIRAQQSVPTTNATPIAPALDGTPVEKPISRKMLIGGGIVVALLLGALLLKKKA